VANTKIPNAQQGQEYLANERTFLAWIRTSIAVVSLGFVVSRFSLWLRELAGQMGRPSIPSRGVSMPMGEALMLFGGVVAILAGWRYHTVNRAIEEDRVKPDRWLIFFVTAAVAVLALVMALAMILAGSRL
jgi:putative membrane protein